MTKKAVKLLSCIVLVLTIRYYFQKYFLFVSIFIGFILSCLFEIILTAVNNMYGHYTGIKDLESTLD